MDHVPDAKVSLERTGARSVLRAAAGVAHRTSRNQKVKLYHCGYFFFLVARFELFYLCTCGHA